MSVRYFRIYFNYKIKYFLPCKSTHIISKIRELNMKAIYTIPAALLLAGASSASLAATQLYLGAQMGYQNTDLEVGYSYGSSSEEQDYSISGVAGGLFAGVRFDINESVFIAPEVNVGTSNADGGYRWSGTSSNYEVEGEAGTSYGLGVLIGSNLSASTTVYGRLGYQRTDYELTESGSFMDTSSDEETFGGVRYGVGMETAVSDQVAVRLDWSQTQYSEEDFAGDWDDSYSYEPTESLFQAGVVYKF